SFTKGDSSSQLPKRGEDPAARWIDALKLVLRAVPGRRPNGVVAHRHTIAFRRNHSADSTGPRINLNNVSRPKAPKKPPNAPHAGQDPYRLPITGLADGERQTLSGEWDHRHRDRALGGLPVGPVSRDRSNGGTPGSGLLRGACSDSDDK